MISKRLVKEVHKEAKKLKVTASADELENLDFSYLSPTAGSRCIYGQLTGDCFTSRAIELIKECAAVGIHDSDVGSESQSCKIQIGKKTDIRSGNEFWSPIEVYIGQNGADNKHLIDYLKGDIKKLDLTPTINC